MRISNSDFLGLMQNALAARLAVGNGVAEDPLLLSGLTTLVARGESGTGTVAWMRDETEALAARIAAVAPDSIQRRSEELVVMLSQTLVVGMDPVPYFRRALAFFADVISDFGPLGEVVPEFMPIVAEIAEWETRIQTTKAPPRAPRAESSTAEPPLTAAFVEGFMASTHGADPTLKVTQFEEITGGMSKQAYRLTTASESSGTREMIIKRSAGEPIAAIDCMQLVREYGILKAVSALGLMAPQPISLGRALPGSGGDFYIMEKSPGSCTTSFLTTAAPISKSVLLQIAQQMARLHTLGLDSFADFIRDYESPSIYSATTDQMVAKRLERWRELQRDFTRTASPVEEYLFSWLFKNIPPNPAPPSLVHGDLVPHNCLWEGDALTAVLDWEGAHFGDPAEDLAYAKPHIEQRMDWHEFVRHYEASGGPRISPRAIEYHSCYSNFRSLLIANVLVTRLPPGSPDLRPLIVDSAFTGMFIDICMTSARNFDRMGLEGEPV